MEMASPRNEKEVQSLNGKVAVLNKFVSRLTNKCLPFFRTLKKSSEWTAECQQAFEDIKAYLSCPPLLSPSKPGEKLFLYLVVSPAVVSAALVREEEKVQKPVYYTSRELRGIKERYPLDGETSLRPSYRGSQTQTLFLGPHSGLPDRQAHTESNE